MLYKFTDLNRQFFVHVRKTGGFIYNYRSFVSRVLFYGIYAYTLYVIKCVRILYYNYPVRGILIRLGSILRYISAHLNGDKADDYGGR